MGFPRLQSYLHIYLFERTGNITDSRHFGSSCGCRIQCKRIGNARIFVEIIQFSPEIILCNPRTSDIIAKNDRYIIFKCRFRTCNYSLKHNISVKLFNFSCVGNRTIKQCIRKCRRNCCAKKCFSFLE